ncbi:hypothetical protein BU15DRAFT_81190 [Melanogaster broomeanus]|nr:hypothetical protein BU15DRAFT_81190 [Melanogaster broomeanus]
MAQYEEMLSQAKGRKQAAERAMKNKQDTNEPWHALRTSSAVGEVDRYTEVDAPVHPSWNSCSALWDEYRGRYGTELRRSVSLGIVRVMFATGTHALGINAPTKTSVFCGDSRPRPCADNVLDMLGGEDTTFSRKLSSRVLSKLHSLGTNFHVTSTLILRLFNVLECPENAPVAVDVVQRLFDLLRLALVKRHSPRRRK